MDVMIQGDEGIPMVGGCCHFRGEPYNVGIAPSGRASSENLPDAFINEEEGSLAILPQELRFVIWSFIQDDRTYAQASQVNQRWHRELLEFWRKYAEKRDLLYDLSLWEKFGKDWTWVLRCRVKVFSEAEQKNGLGTVFEDDGVYSGEWLNNEKNGLGLKLFDRTKNSYYIGYWRLNKKHGSGIKTWPNGDKYDGDWLNGERHGNGVYTWASGDKYSGEWQHSQHHGNGVFEWYSGAKYFGSFKFNKRNDKHGTFTWHNGDRYEGGFKDDMLEGFGSYFHACGDQFIGEWKGGNRHGKALYKYAYGGTFEGTFQEDNREGPGVFTWPDEDRFEGVWHEGARVGPGTLYLKNGTIINQVWKEPSGVNYSEKIPPKFVE